jgi:hypothetical protein
MNKLSENEIRLQKKAEICCEVDKQIICKLPHLQGWVTAYLLLPESFQILNCYFDTVTLCPLFRNHSGNLIATPRAVQLQGTTSSDKQVHNVTTFLVVTA